MKNYKSNQYIARRTQEVKRMKDKQAINFMSSYYRNAYIDGYADASSEIILAVEKAIKETSGIGKKIGRSLRKEIKAALKSNDFIDVELEE